MPPPFPPASPKTNLDCLDIYSSGASVGTGRYTIEPILGSPVEVECDMDRAGGGWTLAVKNWYGSGLHGYSGAVGSVGDALSLKGNGYKLSDTDIRAVIGTGRKFDYLVDQSGYNTAYSYGNYEYVVVYDYTADWKFDSLVATSETTTSMVSYRASDNAVMATFNLVCGTAGGANSAGCGINCITVAAGSINPAGGSGCSINVGKQSDGGWHHHYMSEHNGDTYMYICNGAQHSSGQEMNHRYWFRKAD